MASLLHKERRAWQGSKESELWDVKRTFRRQPSGASTAHVVANALAGNLGTHQRGHGLKVLPWRRPSSCADKSATARAAAAVHERPSCAAAKTAPQATQRGVRQCGQGSRADTAVRATTSSAPQSGLGQRSTCSFTGAAGAAAAAASGPESVPAPLAATASAGLGPGPGRPAPATAPAPPASQRTGGAASTAARMRARTKRSTSSTVRGRIPAGSLVVGRMLHRCRRRTTSSDISPISGAGTLLG